MISDLETLGSVPRAIAAAALLFAAALGLGRFVISPRAAVRGRTVDAVLLRLAVGLNLVGLLGVTLGQLRLLSGNHSWWLLSACGLLNLADAKRLWQGAIRKRMVKPFPSCSRLLPAFLLAVPVVLITLGPALCYPTGWDELVYHSVLPRRWLRDGHPAFYIDLPYSGFPSLGEILFWLVAPLEGVIAARLISWLCWIGSLVALYQVLRRRLRSNSALLLTTTFASSPTLLLVSANCYVETILALNVAALLLAARYLRHDRWRLALTLGILAGGSAGVKLTGFAAWIVPCLWYAGEAWRRSTPFGRRGIRKIVITRPPLRTIGLGLLAISLAVAVVVSLPFYLRPYLATGDPFFPYFAQWFTQDPARIEMSRYHHALGGAAFGMKGIAAFLTGPLLLACSEPNFDGTFGWQFLVQLALAAFAMRARPRKLALWPAAVSAALYTFWFLTAQQARFAIPAALALVPAAGVGLGKLPKTWRRLALGLLLAAASLSIPWRTAGYYLGSWLAVTGRFTRTHYVDEGTDFDYLPLVQSLHEPRFARAKLMLLFEHRSFYLPRPAVIGTPFFQEAGFTPPERFVKADQILAMLVREQVTHVVMTKSLAGPDRAAGWSERLEPLIQGVNECVRQGRLVTVWESDRYAILEVRQGP